MGLHWPVGSTVPVATSRQVSVGVVGGGIGGLSVALSLLQGGFNV
jgi:glycerol-3-phosphate dehydrogenase